jgi:hypothetical protein
MASTQSLDFPFQRLRKVRNALLRLHKALLDSERLVYEQSYGAIPTKGEFFRLVVGHEWFQWLRPISQFIVKIDETLSDKEPAATLQNANDLLLEARHLLHPNQEGTVPQKRYYQAIQRDPEIALLHAEVADLLK